MGLADEQIPLVWDNVKGKCIRINEILIENGRKPFFSNTEDSYQTAYEYRELMKRRTEEELYEIFGCSFKDYIPETFEKEE